LGRIQVNPPAGAFYLDDLMASEVYDNTTAEYLLEDMSYIYKWQPSRNGLQVENALVVRKEGHLPFYIGVTKFNFKVVIGKVRPGQGLFFIDGSGKQRVTSSYNVLTCTSPYASKGVYQIESDKSWFTQFGCPQRKEWNYKQWRCVCKDEWKGLFNLGGGVWSEEKCSYVAA
jgi:hypothetical protein